MTVASVVWFTGLPSSGKSTLAQRVRERLQARGVSCVLLDGDEVRDALIPRPGYDDAGRGHFYETLARLAALHARQGSVVLVAATANVAHFRARARALCSRLLEVYVEASIDVARQRDSSKGLYAQADEAAGTTLPGLGRAYHPPATPDVTASGGYDNRAADAIVEAVTNASDEEYREVYIGLVVRPTADALRHQTDCCFRFGLIPRSELHVTLVYIPLLAKGELARIGNALTRIPLAATPSTLAITGLGGAVGESVDSSKLGTEETLAAQACWRVAWWAVEKTDMLCALRSNVLIAVRQANIATPSDDEFWPHVTVGSHAPAGPQLWDVHGVVKQATLGTGGAPNRVSVERLHVTHTSKHPGSLLVLRYLEDGLP